MDTQPATNSRLRFGSFEFDPVSVELRRSGVRVRIQQQPLQLLAILLEHPGQMVTREELQKRLWTGGTFVGFEDGLNTAIRKLREALDDDPRSPHFIETVPRRGYRLIAEVTSTGERNAVESLTAAAVSSTEDAGAAQTASRRIGRLKLWVSLSLALGVAAALAFWLTHGLPAFSFSSRDSVLVTDFENGTGEPRLDDALRTAFSVSLEQSRHFNVFPRARLGSVLQRMGKPDDTRITPTVGREICQRENIRGLISLSIARTGQEYALSAELIDPQTGATVRSYRRRVHSEDGVLDALDRISDEARADLGESLYEIHTNNRPLPEVTTSSLDALKAYADGNALWHQGKYHDAVALYQEAVTADPGFAMAHAALGNAYYSYIFNDAQRGGEEYQKALVLDSRTTERERMNIQVNYADSRSHVEEADRLYQIYLKRYPDDWPMLAAYARFLRTHGNAVEAIAQFRQMLRVAPNDARTQVEMANAYKTLGRLHEAIAAYQRGFQIDPSYIDTGDISREYGFALVRIGEIQQAEQLFTSELGNAKTRETGLRSQSLLDLFRGKYAAARPLLDEALALDEGMKTEPVSVAREHLQLAILAAGQGDAREEKRQLDAVMADFKTLQPEVILGAWIGSEYARAGLLEKAEQIEGIVTPLVDGRNPEQLAYAHFLQGEIALAKRDNDKAIQLFGVSQQEKSTPYNVEALARAYQQSGKVAEAVSQYEKLINGPVGGPGWEPQQRWLASRYTLAADYLALGNPAKARDTLNPLLALWNDADQNLSLRKQAMELNARLQ